MKIILFYENFLRDYRGLLLLKTYLHQFGHEVWLHPLWNNAIGLMKYVNPDTIVLGQIAESQTSIFGKFAKENGINIVINTTESVSTPDNLVVFFLYDVDSYNDEIIDYQVIPNKDLYEVIAKTKSIKEKNKYKLIGFPRLDISINKDLNNLETLHFRQKYNLDKYQRIFLYVSSFLFEFYGINEKDDKIFNSKSFHEKTEFFKTQHEKILKKFTSEYLGDKDILLIKKHPWDDSSYFKDTYKNKTIILDHAEYIVPCITNADYILHKFSTVSIEGWILDKKTISILPDMNGKTVDILNHMKHEVIVKNYDELIDKVENYPIPIPGKEFLKNYKPHDDGLATYRLAKLLDTLTPKENKKYFPVELHPVRQIVNFLRYGKRKGAPPIASIDVINRRLIEINQNNRIYSLLYFETQKSYVNSVYQDAFNKYVHSVIQNAKELKM